MNGLANESSMPSNVKIRILQTSQAGTSNSNSTATNSNEFVKLES